MIFMRIIISHKFLLVVKIFVLIHRYVYKLLYFIIIYLNMPVKKKLSTFLWFDLIIRRKCDKIKL